MSSSKNLEHEKTSFLNKSNNTFIEEMYVRFIEKDSTLPESWKKYFEVLDDDIYAVIKEIEGPTWKPNKKKINIKSSSEKKIEKILYNEDSEINKKQSIKAIALIRAYRIRGHLIANLDPLENHDRLGVTRLNIFSPSCQEDLDWR